MTKAPSTPLGTTSKGSASRVIVLGAPELKGHLAKLDVACTMEKQVPRLFAPRSGHDARAIIIHRDVIEGFDLAATISRILAAWPLVDLIVWAPGAESSFVRDALKAGAKDVLLTDSDEICARAIANTISGQQLMPRAARIGFEHERRASFEGMLARSGVMWDLFDTATRIAATDAAVLLLGETGTGKELLARAIHRCSGRDGRFVAINCAAIPDNLIDSELFGHVKGAFTGATSDKAGLFRHADKGTLMLDEIGRMPPAAQHHLLRALQENAVRPVGAHKEIPVDVRIIAATSSYLESEVADGEFREDLYYRLDVLRLEIPPLRRRHQDILFLFGHFVRDLAKQYDLPRPEYTDAFLEAMLEYDWPGNVRQLENFAERFVLTHDGGKATIDQLYELLPDLGDQNLEGSPHRHNRPSFNDGDASAEPRGRTVESASIVDTTRTLDENLVPVIESMEADYLRECLRQTSGRISLTAKIAGISRRTLLRKLTKHGIDKNDYKAAPDERSG